MRPTILTAVVCALSLSLILVPATQVMATQSVDLELNSFDRDLASGAVEFDATLTAADYSASSGKPCKPNQLCYGSLQGQLVSGAVVTLISVNDLSNQPSYSRTFVGEHDAAFLTAVRGRVSGPGGEVVSGWQSVDDPLAPSVSLEIRTLHRDDVSGILTFDLTLGGQDYSVPATPCGPTAHTCYGHVEARAASTGAVIYLGGDDDFLHESFPAEHPYSGTKTAVAIDAVRGRIWGSNGEISTGWIPISAQGVSHGHDMGAAAGLVLVAAGGMSATEGCLTMFPIGPPIPDSSLNQGQAACLEATSGGMSFGGYIASVLPTLTSAQINALLVAAGLTVSAATANLSQSLDFGQTLPTGCSWAGPVTITCIQGGTTTAYRPVSAPPVLDPIYENNFLNNASNRTTNLAPDNPLNQPLPFIWVAPSGREIWREALRTCTEALAAPAGSGLNVGQVLGIDECDDQSIFFSGSDVAEATAHDADVIGLDPALMLLHHASNVEKNSTGVYRFEPSSNPLCAGGTPVLQQCDEFPYFATEEGYQGPLAPLPDYRNINAAENLKQGQRFGSLTSNCPTIRDSLRGSEDRSVLIIPSDELPITFGYCGR